MREAHQETQVGRGGACLGGSRADRPQMEGVRADAQVWASGTGQMWTPLTDSSFS